MTDETLIGELKDVERLMKEGKFDIATWLTGRIIDQLEPKEKANDTRGSQT